MQLNQAGMATGLVSIPLRYMHTPCEVVSPADIDNTARLIAGFLERITPDTDLTPSLDNLHSAHPRRPARAGREDEDDEGQPPMSSHPRRRYSRRRTRPHQLRRLLESRRHHLRRPAPARHHRRRYRRAGREEGPAQPHRHLRQGLDLATTTSNGITIQKAVVKYHTTTANTRPT